MHESPFVLRSLSNIQYRVRIGLLSANFISIRFVRIGFLKLNGPHLARITAYVVSFCNFIIIDVIIETVMSKPSNIAKWQRN